MSERPYRTYRTWALGEEASSFIINFDVGNDVKPQVLLLYPVDKVE